MRADVRLGAWALALLALTSGHHVYGALRFDSPWRAHVAHIAGIIALTLAILFLAARRRSSAGHAALWMYLLVAAALPIGWIGLFEGGYNHALKDLLFMMLPDRTWASLFPAPTYEPPVDFWFEVSGVLQVVLAIPAFKAARDLFRSLRPA